MEREIGSQTMLVPFGAHAGKTAKILKRERADDSEITRYQLEVEGAIFWLPIHDGTREVASTGEPRLQRELGT